ncbi:MAG: Ldh family oxidoreductase [Gaiella sp.]|nr:Ldh family oxidoreductase [Gaiella sp.]
MRAAIRVPGLAGDLTAAALVEAEQLGERRFGVSLLSGVARDEERCDLPCFDNANRVAELCCAAGLFGPVVVASVAERMVAAARSGGVGIAVLRNLGALGRLAPYVRWVATEGLVGVLAVDAPPFVAPYGGSAAVLGTNPIAFALPAKPRPIVVDVSTSSITMAGLRDAQAAGRDLPLGVALNSDGLSTADIDEAVSATPRGGLMGTLLALLVESLTGGLSGVLPGPEKRTGTLLVLRPVDAKPLVGTRLVESFEKVGARAPGLGPTPEAERITLEPTTVYILDRLVPGWRDDEFVEARAARPSRNTFPKVSGSRDRPP